MVAPRAAPGPPEIDVLGVVVDHLLDGGVDLAIERGVQTGAAPAESRPPGQAAAVHGGHGRGRRRRGGRGRRRRGRLGIRRVAPAGARGRGREQQRRGRAESTHADGDCNKPADTGGTTSADRLVPGVHSPPQSGGRPP